MHRIERFGLRQRPMRVVWPSWNTILPSIMTVSTSVLRARWMMASIGEMTGSKYGAIKAGAKRDDFLVDKAARKARKKRRSKK